MSEFGDRLAEACSGIYDRLDQERQAGHPKVDLPGLHLVVQEFARVVPEMQGNTVLPEETVKTIIEDVARKRGIKNHEELEVVCLRYHRILVETEGGFRASQRTEKDVLNPLLHAGCELLDSRLSAGRRKAWIANNHLLLFPEILPMLSEFGGSGKPWSALDRYQERIVFARKINSVRLGYVKSEIKELGLVTPSSLDAGLNVLTKVPPVAYAYHAIESYLEVSGACLDVGCDLRDVRRQLGFRLGEPAARLEDRHWQDRLRDDSPFLRIEKGSTQVRLIATDFVWLTERGLIAPLTVACVLRAANEFAALEALGRRVRSFWDGRGGAPVDLQAFLGAFQKEP